MGVAEGIVYSFIHKPTLVDILLGQASEIFSGPLYLLSTFLSSLVDLQLQCLT